MGLRSYLDKIEHNFEKGGKHEKWYALYEAVDTFFYRPPKNSVVSPLAISCVCREQ